MTNPGARRLSKALDPPDLPEMPETTSEARRIDPVASQSPSGDCPHSRYDRIAIEDRVNRCWVFQCKACGATLKRVPFELASERYRVIR